MSSIVFQTNPKTGITYAYESFSYWDKEKKQPRSKRKYLGKLDPETGEIIRAKHREDPGSYAQRSQDPTVSKLRDELARKTARIGQLEADLAALSSKYDKAEKTLQKIASLLDAAREDAHVSERILDAVSDPESERESSRI